MAKPSKIDAYVALLGVKSDADIAKLAGVSVSAVYQYRRGRGIGVVTRSKAKAAPQKVKHAAKPQVEAAAPKGGRGRPSKLDSHLDIVGILDDAEVARRVGLTVSAVGHYRARHGIPAAGASQRSPEVAARLEAGKVKRSAPRGAYATPRPSKLDRFADLVGVLPDAEVARRAGVTREAVRQYKTKRGITSKGTSSKAAPAAVPAAPTSPAPVNTPPGAVMCWRVALADGGATHLAACTAVEAANKGHAALGGRAIGIALLGMMDP